MRFKKYAHKSIRVHTTVLMRLRLSTLRACLQGELERVTLVSGLKLALVYKQISQVGLLTYHLGQLYQLYWRVSSCVTFFAMVEDLKY